MVDWGAALRIIVFGVSIVFSVMGALALIMWFMGVLYARRERLSGILFKPGVPFRRREPLTEEEVVAITGAIMAYLAEGEAVTDHRRVRFPGSRWVFLGWEELTGAHIRRLFRRWTRSAASNWATAGREMLMEGGYYQGVRRCSGVSRPVSRL